MIYTDLIMVLAIHYTDSVMESITRLHTMALTLVDMTTTIIIDLVKLMLSSMKLT